MSQTLDDVSDEVLAVTLAERLARRRQHTSKPQPALIRAVTNAETVVRLLTTAPMPRASVCKDPECLYCRRTTTHAAAGAPDASFGD